MADAFTRDINVTENPLGPGTTRVLPYYFPPASEDGDRFHSRITRFPFDGVGIAAITNDDVFGPLLKEIIKFRIADEAFGLDPVDWDSRFVFASAFSMIHPC
ncbi:hypothetical protein B0H11DRAFT_2214060 [Mycena galericulata]|nr:hypothetical protein B0H11DRAFT_2214060 [Mycena galericulata]